MKNKNKKNIKKILLSIGLFILFLIIFMVIFYFCNPLTKFNQTFFKIIPYPISLIEKNTVITTRELLSNTESLKKFYSSQDFSQAGMRIDFETKEGEGRLKIKEKEVLNKLIEDKLIQIIANSKGIYISKKEAEEELISKARAAGSIENLALSLKKLYNWSLSDFRDKVVLPRLYLGRLIDYHEQNIRNQSLSESKIKKAYQELKKGVKFKEVAHEYSIGETSKNGGALGWFKEEYLAVNIAEKAYSMEVGEFSEIIQSSLGSHIIYLEETKEENGEKEVKLKQIFTREGSFLNWLNKEKSQLSVKILLRDYYWNKDSQQIKFSDQTLEKKESILRSQSNGDPSIY